VRNKLKLCEKLAVNGKLKHLEENIAEIELIKLIKNLNDDKNVNGILVQLPLPGHIDENKIIETINPIKDVDCFHLENVGKI
jgi:methylenetetrahydrofolate dehydrogenase (NADP+)/methenyltetrahydrofolate cyclohydrolase